MSYIERNRRKVQPIVIKDMNGEDQWDVPGSRNIEQQPGHPQEDRRSAGAAGDALASQWGGRPEPNRARR